MSYELLFLLQIRGFCKVELAKSGAKVQKKNDIRKRARHFLEK